MYIERNIMTTLLILVVSNSHCGDSYEIAGALEVPERVATSAVSLTAKHPQLGLNLMGPLSDLTIASRQSAEERYCLLPSAEEVPYDWGDSVAYDQLFYVVGNYARRGIEFRIKE